MEGAFEIDNASFLVAINLAISALFAGAFMCVAALDRNRRAAKWFAAAFLTGMGYFLFEFAASSFGRSQYFMGGAFTAFLATLTLINIGLARHYEVKPPRAAMATFFVLGMLMYGLSLLLTRNSLPGLFLFQTPFFLMQSIGAAIILSNHCKRPLDLTLGYIFAISSLHFLAKPLIAWATGRVGNPTDHYMETSYALYSQSLGSVLGVAVALLLIILLVRSLLADLAQRAQIDSLSGLLNRGAFYDRLNDALSQRTSNAPPASLIICDIDHFKVINDTCGHGCGDLVIANFGALLSEAVDGCAIAGRVGGEEFAIFLPEHNLAQGVALAEDARNRFQNMRLNAFPEIEHLSASFGVVELAHRDSAQKAISKADQAMYLAKAAGRNCTKTVAKSGNTLRAA